METRVDRFGRIVLPKGVRDELGLEPGDALEIREAEGGVYLRPLRRDESPLRNEGALVVFDGQLDEAIPDPVAWARERRASAVTGVARRGARRGRGGRSGR